MFVSFVYILKERLIDCSKKNRVSNYFFFFLIYVASENHNNFVNIQ